jgi:nondiscriminating glutamyl-tRNA synthetase
MTRIRFAPSPTGNLHIGTLRTALFAWLYAKVTGGTFILRVEDTDRERSETHYETSILEGLNWMGLSINEGPITGGDYGPYRQSERMEQGVYQTVAQQLLDAGQAYYCFDTSAELEAERQAAIAAKKPYVYSRKALQLTPDDIQKKLEANLPHTIRFKMPDTGTLTYTDLIRGDVSFELNLIGDFVIIKSDQSPSYNFAVVVDDIGMKVSHIIRGEDHISNMPRQLCLYDALAQKWPEYAHMPMILGPDKSKLSKRHGATNVVEYKDQGYLSDALFNCLSLLGWSPEGEQELLSRDEIKAQFSLTRVSKSNAVFDVTKLKWMNGQYIRQLDAEKLMTACWPYISDETKAQLATYSKQDQLKAIVSIQDNLETLTQVNDYLGVYVMTETQFKAQYSTLSLTQLDHTVMTHLKEKFQQCNEWTPLSLTAIIECTMTDLSLGKGKVMKPLRLSTTAQKAGPYIIDILKIFGKEKTLNRLSQLSQI